MAMQSHRCDCIASHICVHYQQCNKVTSELPKTQALKQKMTKEPRIASKQMLVSPQLRSVWNNAGLRGFFPKQEPRTHEAVQCIILQKISLICRLRKTADDQTMPAAILLKEKTPPCSALIQSREEKCYFTNAGRL